MVNEQQQRFFSDSDKPNFSVARAILATLWRTKEGTLPMFVNSPYSRALSGKKSISTFLSSISRLKKGGLIQLKTGNVFFLTAQGQQEALFAFISAETLLYARQPKEWDGGWRFVFFDIPEEKRRYRDYLRTTLKTIGFREFQKSVWIYPFHAPAFLKDLLMQEHIKPYVRFIRTERIEDDDDLRRLFLSDQQKVQDLK